MSNKMYDVQICSLLVIWDACINASMKIRFSEIEREGERVLSEISVIGDIIFC